MYEQKYVLSSIFKTKSQKGIGGFLRKKEEITLKRRRKKATGEKVKKKVKKIVKKTVLNKK